MSGSESLQSFPLFTYPLVGHAEICIEGLPYPSPSASKYRVAIAQQELVTDEDPSLQSRVATEDMSPNRLLPASGVSNNCIGLDGQPSASLSSVHTAPVFIDAPVAKTLTELVPFKLIFPVMRLALEFIVMVVSVIVSVAGFSVESSDVAISIPSMVYESIEQTELVTLMLPIEVIAQVAATGCGEKSIEKIIIIVLNIMILFIII